VERLNRVRSSAGRGWVLLPFKGVVSDRPAHMNVCGCEASYATINSKGRVFRPRLYTTAMTYDPTSEALPQDRHLPELCFFRESWHTWWGCV